MRALERLQYIAAALLYTAIAVTDSGFAVQIIYDLVIGLIMLGWWVEGFRLSQLPFAFCHFLQQTLFRLAELEHPLMTMAGLGTLVLAVVCWLAYGEDDYSRFKESGKHKVGFRDFTTKELQNDCSVFYPCVDDGSGEFSVPFLVY